MFSSVFHAVLKRCRRLLTHYAGLLSRDEFEPEKKPLLVAIVLLVMILIISATLFFGYQLATIITSHPFVRGEIPMPAVPALQESDLAGSEVRTQYMIAAALEYASHQMAVAQTLVYVNQAEESLTELLLIVEPNGLPGVFELEGINWADGQPIENYKLEGTTLQVLLPAPLPAGERLALSLTYRLSIPARPSPFGYTENQTNLADWYPFVPPYQNGQGWLTHQAAKVGEHLAYDIADYHVDIQLIDDNQDELTIAASAPAQIKEKRYHYEHKAARNFAWSVSDRYQLLETSVGAVTIQGYIFPEHTNAGQATLQATADALALYNDLFAAYPHPSMTFVETDFIDGLEYEGLYFLNRTYFDQYDGTPQGILIPLAAHETAHQWWYALVGNNQALEPWLDESLAVYSELLFYETYYPELRDWWWQYRILRYQPQGRPNSTIYDHDNSRDYINATYFRGTLFLDELRNQIGNDAFLAFLQNYAAQNTHRQVSSQEFFALLAQHSSKDLTELKEKYFSPAPP
ncbi:MAG: M1 family metallopeptidase [Ardenticatenaceae bacterium]